MLKIKENVNLNKLRKFGFVKRKNQFIINICKDKIFQMNGYVVDINNRQIYNYSVGEDIMDVLFNLINADLVEKVEEEKDVWRQTEIRF